MDSANASPPPAAPRTAAGSLPPAASDAGHGATGCREFPSRILHARGWLGTAFAADGDRLGVVPDEDRDARVWPLATDVRVLPALTRYSASLRSTLTAEEWHEIATEVRAELAAVVPWNAEGPAIERTIASYNRAEMDCLRRRNEATPTPRYGALAIDHPLRPGYGPTVNRRNASPEVA
jgi:hypothetical protein